MKKVVSGAYIFNSYQDHPDWEDFLEKIARYGFHILKTREIWNGTQIVAAHRRNRLLVVATSISDMGTQRFLTGTVYGAVACDDLTPRDEDRYFGNLKHTSIENRVSHFQITIQDTDRDMSSLFRDLYHIGELQFTGWSMKTPANASQSIDLTLEGDHPDTNEQLWNDLLFKSGPDWFRAFVLGGEDISPQPVELHSAIQYRNSTAFVTFTWDEPVDVLSAKEYVWMVKIVDRGSSINSPAWYEWRHEGITITPKDIREFSRKIHRRVNGDAFINDIRQVILAHYGWIAIHQRWPK